MMKSILLVLAFAASNFAWGAYSPGTFIVDGTGTNIMAVKPASTAPIATDPAGVVSISPNGNSVAISSSSLPTGAATSALQTTGNNSLASILAALGSPFQAGGSVGISGTLPAFTATPTFNLGTLNGAATAALQTTINTTLGSPFQAGGSIGNTSFGISGTLPAFTATPTFNLGTLNGAATAALQTTGNTSLASILTALGSPLQAGGTVQTKAPLNSTGSGAAAAATVSTVITLTAPANAVGAFLMNIDTSTANIRWAVNRTASATLGQQLQPGRDVWIPTSHDISLAAESGTQTYDVQWISQ